MPHPPNWLRTALLGFALAAPLGTAEAQNRRTTLTLAGFPLAVASTSASDFDAGAVTLGSTSFTVDLTTNSGGGGFSPRVTEVAVACTAPCPNTGTLGVSGLQWRRNDLGTWNALTTTNVVVETRTATFNGTNDPWSNTLHWRYVLSWTANPPTGATNWQVAMRLTVTAP